MADIVQTRAWLIALGNTTAAVATGIINQGVLLSDIADIEPEDVQTMCYVARKPGGTLPNGNPNPGVNVPGLLQIRLAVAVRAGQYYFAVGRPVTSGIMTWSYIKKFKALTDLVSNWQDQPSLPELGRNVPIMKFLELFREHLRGKLGIRQIPLSYVARDVVEPVLIDEDPIDALNPFSSNYDSFHDELISRARHDHPNYPDDNATVLDMLVGSLSKTEYMSSLKPFQRTRDGRGALLALEVQNLGNSKWDNVIKKAEQMVLNFPWNGTNNRYTLDRHINSHRSAHNNMVRAGEYTNYESPNDHTRVQRLLNSIISTDVKVVSAITVIRSDTTMKGSFEGAADFLLIAAPVPIKDDEMSHNISGVGQDSSNESNGFQRRDIGKTGCELRYYKAKEFYSLPQEQQEELKAWRTEHEKKRKPEKDGEPDSKNGRRNKRRKDRIASMETKIQTLIDAQQATISAATTATRPPPSTSNQALTRVPRPPSQNVTQN